MKKLLMVMLMFVCLTSGCSAVSAPGTVALPASNCQVSPDARSVAMLTPEFRVDVYGQQRIVLDDLHGNMTELYAGNALPYVYPSSDNRFVLFIDRDCAPSGSSSTTGLRDNLWLVEVPSGRVQLLHSSATSFNLYAEPALSPDGRFLAGLEGSGIGDECALDSKLVFIEIPEAARDATSLHPEQFSGFPQLSGQVLYPPSIGSWTSNTQYTIPLSESCNTASSLSGIYVFDVSDRSVTYELLDNKPLITGDLGWGQIHGLVTDATTGQPIQGALVYCEHTSYATSIAMLCAGGLETSLDGSYVYDRIFFHDTDTIKLTVTANGYQSQEYTQNSFTTNDLAVNFSLVPTP